jgi:regulator of RNase E activity RraA
MEVNVDQLDAYTIWDAARALHCGASFSAMQPMSDATTFQGSALTVALEYMPNVDVAKKDYRLCDAIDQVAEGTVLVLDSGGLPLTALGTIATLRLSMLGAAGVVVNGLVRDVEGIREVGLPVFARGSGFYSMSAHAKIKSIGEPVRIDAYTIETGDLVAGCSTGVIVVAGADVPAVMTEAERRLEIDQRRLDEVRGGASFTEVWEKYKVAEAATP